MTKFDGTRTIAYIDRKAKEVRMLNRRKIFFEHRYPELRDIWKLVKAERMILDGEIVVFDEEGKPDFYSLQTREHISSPLRIKLLSESMPATYVVFDVLYKDGERLTEKKLMERKRILKESVEESNGLMLSVWIEKEGRKFFEEARRMGLEGIMAKRKDSPYLIGKRSKLWLKIKATRTLDCIILGFTKGRGWRAPYFGALVLGAWKEGKLRCIGRVGTGWDEEDLKQIKEKLEKMVTKECPVKETLDNWERYEEKYQVTWVKPELVCEVEFLELTQRLELRAPSFKRLREDKPPSECSLEEEVHP